jgi:aminoglycoside phosphotransferase family enzyme/predicted kinase
MDSTDSVRQARALVEALARRLPARLLETHISWVLLGEDTAWKIKKPLRLPFVDYGTLERRRHFCEEELRLNRRLAPSLYLGVARITGSPAAPTLDGPGEALEYAVRMRRFADGALFGEQLAAATLRAEDVDRLAWLVAGLQQRSPPADPAAGFALPQQRLQVALAALGGAAAVATEPEQSRLRQWLQASAAELAPLWAQRREGGAVREGHGDLHLDNVVSLDDGVEAFDCIEFDPALRWIDVLDEIAFPVMDFSARGRDDFAFRLLTLWLDLTGEHGALPALRFAVVYRALVRLHVEHLRHPDDPAPARRYLQAALAWTERAPPQLAITHGLPASGKTVASQQWLQQHGAIRLRSDVERKRLFGLAMLERSSERGLDLYGAQATERTYQRLFTLARAILQAGYPVILDAAFLRHDERQAALARARELGVPFTIVHCEAPPEMLRQRLLARRGDASEADLAVLQHLQAAAEPLTDEERALVAVAQA